MIAFVKGPLVQIEEDMVVVETGGVGLEIRVPLSVLEQLPALGEMVMLYTHFQVKEDGMSLYGFLNRQDKAMFRQLLSVNGVGPKGALGILSVLRPGDLVRGCQGDLQSTRHRHEDGPASDLRSEG